MIEMGTWVFDGEKAHTQTPLAALRAVYGDKVRIIYEPALAYSRDKQTTGLAKAVNAAKQADVVLAFVGEESILSGEAHSLTRFELARSAIGTDRKIVTDRKTSCYCCYGILTTDNS